VHLARDFYVQSARAAQLLGQRAVLLLGQNPPPADPPASLLAWDYLPYGKLFPHAAAIVHQGGVGTTGQALRAGRPMVVMPFAHDQFDNARRVTRLGVGRHVPREKYCAESAARALRDLLADGRATNTATRLAAEMRAERSTEAACTAIERALAAPE
jgi:rhamnosyltransferase subunit B